MFSTAEQTVAPVAQAVEQGVEGVVETVEDTVSEVVDGVEETIDGAVETVKETVSKVVDGVQGGGTASPELVAAVQSELTVQINTQTANPDGLIDQLNDLDSYRATDPDPVPNFPPAIDPSTLDGDIKEKEFTISQLEGQRTAICKQARADARQAIASAKSDMFGMLGGVGIGMVGSAIAALLAMAGGALALLVAICAGIVTEHETYRKLRDTLQSLVKKARADLTVINTSIAIEKNKLVAMKAAAHRSISVDDLPDASH